MIPITDYIWYQSVCQENKTFNGASYLTFLPEPRHESLSQSTVCQGGSCVFSLYTHQFACGIQKKVSKYTISARLMPVGRSNLGAGSQTLFMNSDHSSAILHIILNRVILRARPVDATDSSVVYIVTDIRSWMLSLLYQIWVL